MGIADKLQALKRKKAEENLQKGLLFLAENKKRPEVITTESGLQYEVLKKGEGTGDHPQANTTVTCHYKGYTLEDKIFDSSYERGQAATFPLDRVIKGWTEGLQLMQIGDIFRFYIPQDLAYGDRQVGSDISPFSTLIFEVELITF